jgi:hypothetical protein
MSPKPCTGVGAALAASFGMLRRRVIVTTGLGAAVVFSLLSVCCGIGLFTTPWFICELFAVQIALCTERPIARGMSFVPAGAILLGAVLMVSAVAWITLLGAAPDMPGTAQAPQLLSFTALMRSGGAAALISSSLALLVIGPLLYAPLILIEQQTRFDAALVESVRLVVVSGMFKNLGLSMCAHLVQASPLLLSSVLALLIEPSQVALFGLAATPVLSLSVPLGQGMIVWNYTQVRERFEPTHEPEPRAPAQSALGANRGWVRAWTVLIALPIVSLLLLELALLRPSRIPLGSLSPQGELIAQLTPNDSQEQRVLLSDTTLEVGASPHALRVAASDGGGAGHLPLRAAEPITRVRIARVRDAFAIEVTQGAQTYITWIDRAGVRLDDDLRARLLDRTTPLQLWLFLGSLLFTGIASVPVLHALGRIQRGYRLPADRRPSYDLLVLDQQRSLRRARVSATLLVPLSLACLTMAVLALTSS